MRWARAIEERAGAGGISYDEYTARVSERRADWTICPVDAWASAYAESTALSLAFASGAVNPTALLAELRWQGERLLALVGGEP